MTVQATRPLSAFGAKPAPPKPAPTMSQPLTLVGSMVAVKNQQTSASALRRIVIASQDRQDAAWDTAQEDKGRAQHVMRKESTLRRLALHHSRADASVMEVALDDYHLGVRHIAASSSLTSSAILREMIQIEIEDLNNHLKEGGEHDRRHPAVALYEHLSVIDEASTNLQTRGEECISASDVVGDMGTKKQMGKIAMNPETDPVTLVQLYFAFDPVQDTQRRNVMRNPAFPVQVLERWVKDPVGRHAPRLVLLPHLSDRMLFDLLRASRSRAAVAWRGLNAAKLSKEAATLISGREAKLRRLIGAHPNAGVLTLRAMVNDYDPNVRFVVAMNPRTPSGALSQLRQVEAERLERLGEVGTFTSRAAILQAVQDNLTARDNLQRELTAD